MLRLSDSRPSTGSYEASSFLDTLIRQPNHRRAAVLSILLTACPPSSGDTDATNNTEVTGNLSATTNNNPTDSETIGTDFTTNANDTVLMGSTSMPQPEPETTTGNLTEGTTDIPCEGAPKYGECDMPNEKDPKCNGGVCSNCTEECLCINGAMTYPEDEEPCTSCNRDNGYIKKGENPDGSPICEIYVPKPPTVNRMPQGNNVMPFFSENIIVTGDCEPVDHVQWSYVPEEDEASWDWENDDNWENVTTYSKEQGTWKLNTTLEVGVYKACFRTVKYGITSPNDAVCFRMERVV